MVFEYAWELKLENLNYTYKSHYQDSQEDPQRVAENVHEDNRDQSYT